MLCRPKQAPITQLYDGLSERDDPHGAALQPTGVLFFPDSKEAVAIEIQLLGCGRLPHLCPHGEQ